jgi:membrane protease YdiL (CAAX protease family)
VPSNTRNIFIQVPHGPGLLLYALLVSAVAAPICEEIFFRGMIFRYLRRRWPLWLAALVSATIFGAAHLSPATSPLIVPVLAFIGLVLALVYERTGSLTNSMMLHALNNGVLTTLTYLVITR